MERRFDNRGYNNGDFEDSHFHKRRSSSDADRHGSRSDFADENVYRTIRITNLNPRFADREVSDVVYREFRKFGDFNVKVTYYGEKRIAFVNFRHSEDAVAAMREFYNRLVLFDFPVRLGAVYPRPPPRGQFVGDRDEPRMNRSFSPGRRVQVEPEFQRRESFPHEDYDDRSSGQSFALRQRHLLPEDDSYACRTLFIGNVDPDISTEELKAVFERYGYVEDVDIKKPSPSSGSPYAFIRFFNLDMAHLAKVKLSGKFIGPYQCKIGYGKPAPSSCIWVGGLGPWLNKRKLAKEFDRFGDVVRVVWPERQNYAYISYDNVESAKDAVAKMRGFRFKDAEKKLRTDFVDPKHMDSELNRKHFGNSKSHSSDRRRSFSGSSAGSNSPSLDRSSRSRSSNSSGNRGRSKSHKESKRQAKRHASSSDDDQSSADGRDLKSMKKQKCRSRSATSKTSLISKGSNHEISLDKNIATEEQIDNGTEVKTVSEMIRSISVVWNGLLTLKNSAFHVQMHLVSGNPNLVESLMCDTSMVKFTSLKLTQRLRLDPPKLEEVRRRIQLAGNDWSILVGVPGSGSPAGLTSGMQERSLKNLVTYLRQKEAAGVLSLPPNSAHGQETGLLHTFAPCAFAHEYLLQRAPKLELDSLTEDYIVVILVRVNI